MVKFREENTVNKDSYRKKRWYKMKKMINAGDQWIADHMHVAGALYTRRLISDKWILGILDEIDHQRRRFGQIKTDFNQYNDIKITDSTLTKKVNELIKEKIISKKVFAEVPLHTEYYFTQKGKELFQVIKVMNQFGLKYSSQIKNVHNKASRSN